MTTLSLHGSPSRTARLPGWLRSVLAIPLEMKLLGANLIILGAAVPAVFGAMWLVPSGPTDAYVVAVALMVAAAVNVVLVRLALSPIEELERVTKRVSQGKWNHRVHPSLVADRDLKQLAQTINEMLDNLAAGRERMRKLGAEVVYAEERERARVARDLHDTVGQTLVAACFQIAAVANDMADSAASKRLTGVRDLLRTSIEEIRNLSRSLHPRVADDLGLPAALEALGDATQERSLVEVRVKVDVAGVVIPSALATTLYRVAEEALRNVERHADAGHAMVSLRARPGLVELEVADDGCGFEGPLEERRRQTGLAKISERLSLAGGELHVDSTAERGTRVLARVCIDTEAA